MALSRNGAYVAPDIYPTVPRKTAATPPPAYSAPRNTDMTTQLQGQLGVGSALGQTGQMQEPAGYYDPNYKSTLANLYDQLTRGQSGLDLNQQRIGSDYETSYGRLGQQQGLDRRNLLDTLASQGMVWSGSAVDRQAQQADQYNQRYSDLATQKQRGLEDIARSRLNLEGEYQRGVGSAGAQHAASIQQYIQDQIKQQAAMKLQQDQQRAEALNQQQQQQVLQYQMELLKQQAGGGLPYANENGPIDWAAVARAVAGGMNLPPGFRM